MTEILGQLSLPFTDEQSDPQGRLFRPYIELNGTGMSTMPIFSSHAEAAAVLFSNLGLIRAVAPGSTVQVVNSDSSSFTAYFKAPGEQARVLRGGVDTIEVDSQ